ncbi:response regulator [Gracilibacillus dipsosauri]|uniref:DNA-binding response regulator n=1 Tax=Gracilibacillus dipsosauri TaxID=178340 RepID=A0A317L3A4_9BACI|nr:response regulator transcription factor [Gracilibacillus dipsosauri]PWU69714.1 DNA-binding response regulator [Gracilibacillus dipsosauri]
MIKILLAEDQVLVRQGIKMMIETDPDLKVTGEVGNGKEALKLREIEYFDIAILDVRMPEMDGLKAAREMLGRWPEMKIMMLTTFNDEAYAVEALKIGVHGYLLKDADASWLIHAIKGCMKGGLQLPGEVASKVIPQLLEKKSAVVKKEHPSLTRREQDILYLLGEGKDNKEIATELALSVGTVKNHISQLLHKLNLRDRTQLAIYAIQNDYV